MARLTHNVGYKILALILATWWWTYAQSQQNPRETLNVPVRVQVSDDPQLMLLNGPPTVRVRVRGFRDDLNTFDPNNLTARLDLTEAIPGKKQLLSVIVAMRPHNGVDLLDTKKTVEVVVDKIESLRLPVTHKIEKLLDNYEIRSVRCNPVEVALSGPSSYLRRVRRVWVRINATSAPPPSTMELPVEVVDATDAIVPEVKPSPPRVQVALAVREKAITRTFRVAPQIIGSPAQGFRMTETVCDPNIVLLSGEPSMLKSLPAVTTEPVDIAGAKENVARRVGLRLPDGVTAQGSDQVRVEVHIVPEPQPPTTNNQ
jgi:YbbR domain-containing protein